MKDASKVRKIGFVGDRPPRKCGIATFTADPLAAVGGAHPQSQCLAVSVNDIAGGYQYPEVVRFEIEEQDRSSYLRAAGFLNISNVDIICVQHEFGIYGGPAGGHILALLRQLRMPAVTTLYTVLRQPGADQRRVMNGRSVLSTRLVVMAERGRLMLQVSGCLEAFRATSDLWWHEPAQRAFDWFIGWNDLGLELYSPDTGGCRDGLHVDRVNGNQAAESTPAFLLSLAEMQLAQNINTTFKEPLTVSD